MTLVENKTIKFAEYLATHPHLYDGIDLTGAEIEKINRHFWDYKVKELDFSNHFLEAIDNALERYHKMKAIEFVEQISDITTNKEILKVAGHVASDGSSTSIGSADSTTTIGARHSETDNKEANRQLPMNSANDGSDFDDLIDWSQGGSGIGESKSESNTRQTEDSVTASDSRTLTNLANQWNTNDSERTVIGKQAVDCIYNIWLYLSQPKAIQWLFDQVEKCFILVW